MNSEMAGKKAYLRQDPRGDWDELDSEQKETWVEYAEALNAKIAADPNTHITEVVTAAEVVSEHVETETAPETVPDVETETSEDLA